MDKFSHLVVSDALRAEVLLKKYYALAMAKRAFWDKANKYHAEGRPYAAFTRRAEQLHARFIAVDNELASMGF